MHHNKMVSDNVKEIKSQVAAATTEQDLINVIQTVKNHPGPLDYRNGYIYFIIAIMVYFSMVGLIEAFAFDGRTTYGSGADGFILSIISFIATLCLYGLPALLPFCLAIYGEKRGVVLPVPEPFNLPVIRIALLTLFPTALFYRIPGPEELYLEAAKFVLYISSGGDKIYVHPLIGIPLLITALILFVWCYLRSNWRESLSDQISSLDTLFNNNLTEIDFEPETKTKELIVEFRLFDRGSHSRSIQAMYHGQHQGDVHHFDIQVFFFEFTNKRHTTRTNAKGEQESDVEYDHYYRQGIIVDFPWIKSVMVNGDVTLKTKGNPYTTASNQFNRAFRVTAEEHITAARLLTPAMVEMLTEFQEKHPFAVLEFNREGRLCIAFEGEDLLSIRRNHGLSTPDDFCKEITGHSQLKQLDQLKEIAHSMMQLCDNNFTAQAENNCSENQKVTT